MTVLTTTPTKWITSNPCRRTMAQIVHDKNQVVLSSPGYAALRGRAVERYKKLELHDGQFLIVSDEPRSKKRPGWDAEPERAVLVVVAEDEDTGDRFLADVTDSFLVDALKAMLKAYRIPLHRRQYAEMVAANLDKDRLYAIAVFIARYAGSSVVDEASCKPVVPVIDEARPRRTVIRDIHKPRPKAPARAESAGPVRITMKSPLSRGKMPGKPKLGKPNAGGNVGNYYQLPFALRDKLRNAGFDKAMIDDFIQGGVTLSALEAIADNVTVETEELEADEYGSAVDVAIANEVAALLDTDVVFLDEDEPVAEQPSPPPKPIKPKRRSKSRVEPMLNNPDNEFPDDESD